ncbi:general substrate transporter [Aspergillus homomorphus CBS 101889]|uniref:General substrate transporter n=1 Tax=Aspergillus homomorphus (strain CBS 101889) TaxID=1450537 RepID=A0A395HWZ5_ASPHC|nr:general substrate transporter [Aspergillus homomorphus CBS 101889]RAL11378.1 general substrate transporter [Aspergillus homomorphus CBS 101889]
MSDTKSQVDTSYVESTTTDDRLKNQEPATHDRPWQCSLEAAKAANAREHEMSVTQALKLFPWAVAWSLVPSIAIVMEGYDTILITSFFGYPAFRTKFGEEHSGKGYQVAGSWQSALGAAGNLGCMVGALINGFLIERLGFKRVFLLAQVLMCAFICIPFFGDSVGLQVAGQTLCGLPWGIFATLGPAYSSELCPMVLRPYLTAFVNVSFVMGQLISAGVLQGLIDLDNQWSYRIPFALQWVWPVPLFVFGCFMPESPWWHVRKGQYDSASKIVNRLLAEPNTDTAHQTVAMMIHTNNLENEIKEGSYLDCFCGPNSRRTEIACMALAGQVFAGIAFAYSPTYFFEQAGMSDDDSYKLGLGGAGLAFVGTTVSGLAMHYLGRRIMYVGGMGLMSVYLLVIGCMTPATKGHNSNPAVLWAQSVVCIIWLFTFSLTVGPIAWVIPPEVSSTRLRSKTVVLARNSYYVASVVANGLEPLMLNPTAWNWRGYAGFFWFGSAFLTFVWSYFRLPETKGRTYEELDLMFAREVPTREFGKYQVDAYEEDSHLS